MARSLRDAAHADAAAGAVRRGRAVLSAIGIYGVLAFGVAQRVARVRHPPGARRRPRAILTLVLAQGLRTAGIGVVLGLAGSLALTRYLQSLLFGVGAHDVSVFRRDRPAARRCGRRLLHARAAGDAGRSDGRTAGNVAVRNGRRTKT